MKFCKPPWIHIKVKKAIGKKSEALKHFEETPTVWNKTRLLKLSQKTLLTVIEAKFIQFSSVPSNCMDKHEKFRETLNKKTGKENGKTNHILKNESEHTINSPTNTA